jgi:hypothetical protein
MISVHNTNINAKPDEAGFVLIAGGTPVAPIRRSRAVQAESLRLRRSDIEP